MTDPFGLMKFAECEHQQLKCEHCGARSDIRGWSTFTGQDKEMMELREANEALTARLAAAEDLLREIVKGNWCVTDVQEFLGDINKAAKGGRDER